MDNLHFINDKSSKNYSHWVITISFHSTKSQYILISPHSALLSKTKYLLFL